MYFIKYPLPRVFSSRKMRFVELFSRFLPPMRTATICTPRRMWQIIYVLQVPLVPFRQRQIRGVVRSARQRIRDPPTQTGMKKRSPHRTPLTRSNCSENDLFVEVAVATLGDVAAAAQPAVRSTIGDTEETILRQFRLFVGDTITLLHLFLHKTKMNSSSNLSSSPLRDIAAQKT